MRSYNPTINPATGNIIWEHNYGAPNGTIITFVDEIKDNLIPRDYLNEIASAYCYPKWAQQYIQTYNSSNGQITEICIDPQGTLQLEHM